MHFNRSKMSIKKSYALTDTMADAPVTLYFWFYIHTHVEMWVSPTECAGIDNLIHEKYADRRNCYFTRECTVCFDTSFSHR